jgi:ketosteroid isomerase-like protein
MKKLAAMILFVAACVGPAWAQADKAEGKGPTTADAVKQLEHDWTDATIKADTEKLAAILADDWRGIGPDGSIETKKQFIDSVKSGKLKLTSFDFGPMEVKVVGTTAIVQGSDTEKGSYEGKENDGKSVWMDVFAKRNGQWQAVRSQTAMLK